MSLQSCARVFTPLCELIIAYSLSLSLPLTLSPVDVAREMDGCEKLIDEQKTTTTSLRHCVPLTVDNDDDNVTLMNTLMDKLNSQALDRYRVIVNPTREACHPLKTIITLTAIWAFALVLASPLFFFRKVETVDLKDYSECYFFTLPLSLSPLHAAPRTKGLPFHSYRHI